MKNKKEKMKTNKVKGNIFKVILITMFISVFGKQSYAQDNSMNVEVKSEYETSIYCLSESVPDVDFTESTTAPPTYHLSINYQNGIKICGESGDKSMPTIYKHVSKKDGKTIYSIKPTMGLYVNAMDILKAMPQIGTSRVDPNLIEY